jgi:hypothetical protein
MLEEMGKAGAAGTLVPGTNVIPDVDGDDRDVMVLVNDDVETIGECLLEERKRCVGHAPSYAAARITAVAR